MTHRPNWYDWLRVGRRWTTLLVTLVVGVAFVLFLTYSVDLGASQQGGLGPVNVSHDEPVPRSDIDRDGLVDRHERAGETNGGYVLTGADPNRMDLYLHLYLTEGVAPLTPDERAALRANWAEFPVENPDNSTGIRLHLTTHRVDERFVSDFSRRDLREWAANMDDEQGPVRRQDCAVYVGVLGTAEGSGGSGGQAGRAGLAYSPGHLFIADGGDSHRTDVITHELLHNVVGQFEDGSSHTTGGWLAARAPFPSLSDQTATKLTDDGFAHPEGEPAATC